MKYQLTQQYCLLKFSGDQSKAFLQGQLTCDLEQITEQQSCLAGYCNRQGRLIASGYLTQIDKDYVLLLDRSIMPSTQETLQKYAQFSRVKVEDMRDAWQIHGLIHEDNTLAQIQIPNSTRRILLTPLSEGMLEAESDYNSWQAADIEEGIALLTAQTQGLFLPQMLNYQLLGAVSFNKGCYIGQEIVARTQHLGKLKRHLYQLQSDETMEIGDAITDSEGVDVGCIVATTAANSSRKALAVVQDSATEKELLVKQQKITLTALTAK